MQHPVVEAVPILTVASALGIEVDGRKARCFNGSAHKRGTDENPSLIFQPASGRFKCFACGVGGDAIDLVRGVLGVSFGEAVRRLSELATRVQANSPGQARTTSRIPTSRAMDVYARLFELSCIPEPESRGGEYLRGRCIDSSIAIPRQVAYLDDPDEVWRDLNAEFEEAELAAAGLVSRRGGFLFGGHRLLFFYFDRDWPQFVVARDMSGQAKCKELSLAGLHSPIPYLGGVLREKPARVFVCEGCIDALSATQLGYCAVGVPGVVGFRDDWFALFRGVGHVTILFDDDPAGHRQSAELRSRFRMRGIRADSQFPRPAKDVNDLLKTLNRGKSS